jgi:hypothetical protein
VAYTLGVAVKCAVVYSGVISHPNERHPMNTTMQNLELSKTRIMNALAVTNNSKARAEMQYRIFKINSEIRNTNR